MERKIFPNLTRQKENFMSHGVSESSCQSDHSVHENKKKNGDRIFLPIGDKKCEKDSHDSHTREKIPLQSKNVQEGSSLSSTKSDSSTEYSCLASLKSSNSKKKIRSSKTTDKPKTIRNSSHKRLTKQSSPGCLCDPGTESRTSSSASPLNSSKDFKRLSDNLSRRERLEALKARIEVEREKYLDSSSEEEEKVVYPKLSRYNSDDALYKSRRSRNHLRRMSYDETGLLLRKSNRGYSPLNRRHSYDSDKSTDMPHNSINVADVKNHQCVFQNNQEYHYPERLKENYKLVGSLLNRSEEDGSNNSITFLALPDANKRNNEYKGISQFENSSLEVPSSVNEVPRIFQPSPLDSGVSSQSVPSSPSLVRAPTPPPRSSQTHAIQPSSYKPVRSRPLSAAVVLDYRERCRQFGDPEKFSFHGYAPRQPIQKTITLHDRASESGQKKRPNSSEFKTYESRKSIKDCCYADENGNCHFYDKTPSAGFNPLYIDERPKILHPSHLYGQNKSRTRSSELSCNNNAQNLKISEHPHFNNFQRVQANCYNDGTDTSKFNDNNFHTTCSQNYEKFSAMHKFPSDAHFVKCVPKCYSPVNDSGILPLKSNGNKYDRKYISSFTDSPLPPTPKRRSGGSPTINSLQTSEQKQVDSSSKDPPLPPIRKRLSGGSPTNVYMNKTAGQETKKSNHKNLDKAFTELEEIYQNLNLNGDKDLLDRAERRDLPTKFQLYRNNSPSRSTDEVESANRQGLVRSYSDNIQSLLRRKELGTFESQIYKRPSEQRRRRSGVPDKIKDDLAYRKQKNTPQITPPNNRNTSSYLLCSPHFTPSIPVDDFMMDFTCKDQPNVEQDDLSYRMYTQSSSSKIIPPHPPFGIPLQPAPQSSNSNYLYAKPNGLRKPVFRPQSTPDIVTDDMAFRNLRKDDPQIVKNEHGYLSDVTPDPYSYQERRRQHIASSLSANIARMMMKSKEEENLPEFQKSQSMTDMVEILESESNRWQELEDPYHESDSTEENVLKGQSFTTKGGINGTYFEEEIIPEKTTMQDQMFCVNGRLSSKCSNFSAIRDNSSGVYANDPRHFINTHPNGNASRTNNPNRIDKQFPFYPRDDLKQNEFITNSEIPHRKITPLDESHLDELLTSLAHDTRDLPSLHPPVTARRSGTPQENKATALLRYGNGSLSFLEDYSSLFEMNHQSNEYPLDPQFVIPRGRRRTSSDCDSDSFNKSNRTSLDLSDAFLNYPGQSRKRFISRDQLAYDQNILINEIIRSSKLSRLQDLENAAGSKNIPCTFDSRNIGASSDSGSILKNFRECAALNSMKIQDNTDEFSSEKYWNSKTYKNSSNDDSDCKMCIYKDKVKDKSSKRKSSLNQGVVEDANLMSLKSDEIIFGNSNQYKNISDHGIQNSGSERKENSSLCHFMISPDSREGSCDSQDSQPDVPSRNLRYKTSSENCILKEALSKKLNSPLPTEISALQSSSVCKEKFNNGHKVRSGSLQLSSSPENWIVTNKSCRSSSETEKEIFQLYPQDCITKGIVRRRRATFEELQSSNEDSVNNIKRLSNSPSDLIHCHKKVCSSSESHNNRSFHVSSPFENSPRLKSQNKKDVCSQLHSPVMYNVTVKTSSKTFDKDDELDIFSADNNTSLLFNSSNFDENVLDKYIKTKEKNANFYSFGDCKLPYFYCERNKDQIKNNECSLNSNGWLQNENNVALEIEHRNLVQKSCLELKELEEMQGILKPILFCEEEKKPHSILKRKDSDESEKSSQPLELQSILRRKSSEESDNLSNSEIHSILRRKSSDEQKFSLELKPILKKKNSLEEPLDNSIKNDLKSILKKRNSYDYADNFQCNSNSKKNNIEITKTGYFFETSENSKKPILKKIQEPTSNVSTFAANNSGQHNEFVLNSNEYDIYSGPVNNDQNFHSSTNSFDVSQMEPLSGITNPIGKLYPPVSSQHFVLNCKVNGIHDAQKHSDYELESNNISFDDYNIMRECSEFHSGHSVKVEKYPNNLPRNINIPSENSSSSSTQYIHKRLRTDNRSHSQPINLNDLKEASRLKASLPSKLNHLNDLNKVDTSDITEAKNLSDYKVHNTNNRSSDSPEEKDDDEILKLSVAEKALLFQQLESKQKHSPFAPCNSKSKASAKRFLPRFQTQPVTVEELHQASKMVDTSDSASSAIKDKSQTSDSEDEPSKLSLKEKMKLFNKMSEDSLKPKAETRPVIRRQSFNARFKTQPITCEEIKNIKHSPTVGAFSKQLESKLQKIPVSEKEKNFAEKREQVEKMINLPRLAMSKTGPCFPRMLKESESEDTKVENHKGILKTKTERTSETEEQLGKSSEIKSILKPPLHKRSQLPGEHLKSVLKKSEQEEKPIKPILKLKKDRLEESSSDSSSSCSDSDDDDDKTSSSSYSGPKTVLSGGMSHIIFKKLSVEAAQIANERKPCSQTAEEKTKLSVKQSTERKNMHGMNSCDLVSSTSASLTLDKAEKVSQEKNVEFVLSEELQVNGSESERYFQSKSMTKDLEEGAIATSKGSIVERLAALKRSGEEDWKRRLESLTLDDDGEGGCFSINMKQMPYAPASLPSSIAERLNQLEEAQDQWRNRIGQKDSTQFTVAGKMGHSLLAPRESPLLERKKRVPKAVKFRSKTSDLPSKSSSVSSSPALPAKLSKSSSTPNTLAIVFNKEHSSSDSEGDENFVPSRTLVPKADNETFTTFFESVKSSLIEHEKVDITEDSFNLMTSESHQLLSQKKSVRISRKHIATQNPLKALASRTDIQQAYEERTTGLAEREIKRIKVEKLAKSSDLALSALAGLASTEDFRSVALKKSSTGSGSLIHQKDLMLVQVKGRRHVQVRLVEPHVDSINTGDSFVLVTPSCIYNWMGKFSNVIERSKALDFATRIQFTKDLCFTGFSNVAVIDEEKNPSSELSEKFFSILGVLEPSCQTGEVPEEDELYEAAIIDTNMVYQVKNNELIPYEKYWGRIPKIDMLNSDEVIVFDFGGEMYVWQGKLAPFELRKSGEQLAKELWDQGYDYSECDISPLKPQFGKGFTLKDSERPSWALFSKTNQHMEPVLFKEKFLDWPDSSKIIQVKSQTNEESKVPEELHNLTFCDVKEMLYAERSEPDLILEGSHISRGIEYHDTEERRHYEITTLAIKVWHVMEYNHFELPKESYGQFHSGDTYVVRWQYVIKQTGRDLYGKASRHSFAGRDRCAYFFWQGKDSTITEKGASALMTVELDEERGPHVRVDQGKEPPCFLNLFKNYMIVHRGKRESKSTGISGQWKFFMVRGEVESEGALVEISRGAHGLRSRSCFVLVSIVSGTIYIWQGSKSVQKYKKIAVSIVDNIIQRKPEEMKFAEDIDFKVIEQEEGSECKEFWQGLGGRNHNAYISLLEEPDVDHTPRLFHLSSVSGSFSSQEILCPFRCEKSVCAFPFLQSELYTASQPALFLLDNEKEVFIWQGWWPEEECEGDNVVTGSAIIRWSVDRRCALETALNYCEEKNSEDSPKAYVVTAGVEPTVFTNLFPEWEQRDDVALNSRKYGKKPGDMVFIQEVLSELTRDRFSHEELSKQPLPEGVNPLHLESYLTDIEFEEVLSMRREEFYGLPSWKQSCMKKEAGLF